MPRVRLEDGTVINFDKQPTMADIEDAVAQIKGNQPSFVFGGGKPGKPSGATGSFQETIPQLLGRNFRRAVEETTQPLIGFTNAALFGFPEFLAGKERFKELTSPTAGGRFNRGVGTALGTIVGPGTVLNLAEKGAGMAFSRFAPALLKKGIVGKIAQSAVKSGAGFGAVEAVSTPEEGFAEKLQTVPRAIQEGTRFGSLFGGLGAAGTKLFNNKFVRNKIKGFLEKTLAFTTPNTVTETVIKRALDRGIDKVYTPKNRSVEAFRKLGNNIRKNLERLRSQRGAAVGRVKQKLRNKHKVIIPIDDIVTQFRAGAKDILRKEISRDLSPVRLIKKPTTPIEDWVLHWNRILSTKEKTIRPKDALEILDDIGSVAKWKEEGKLSVGDRANNLLIFLRKSLKDRLIGNTGALGREFAIANKRFERLANLQKKFKGNLNESAVAGFLENTTKDVSRNNAQWVALKELNREFSPNQRFLEKLQDIQTARALDPLVFSGIRSGSLGIPAKAATNILLGGGAGLLLGNPISALAGGVLGATLSTPRGVAKLIGAGQKGVKNFGRFGKFAKESKRLLVPGLLKLQRR